MKFKSLLLSVVILGALSPITTSAYTFTTNLYRGVSGNDVKALQEILTSSGDYTYGEITGYYGEATVKAVEKYQCRMNIVCTGNDATTGFGVVGPTTRSMLSGNAGASVSTFDTSQYSEVELATLKEKLIEQIRVLIAELKAKGVNIGFSVDGSGDATENTDVKVLITNKTTPPENDDRLITKEMDTDSDVKKSVSYLQYTANDEWQSYRSKNRDQLYIYQGDLKKMGRTVEEIARALKPFDFIVLTNAFDKTPSWTNGKCIIGTFEDDNGKDVGDLIELLRSQNSKVEIYGYVSSTADNGAGCWSTSVAAQNYICPEGICIDFVKWVNKWKSYETSSKRALDGVFIDLFNLVFVNSSAMVNQVSYAHSIKNSAGDNYKVVVNLTNNSPAYYYGKPGNAYVTTVDNPINVAKSVLKNGDIILAEGLYLKAGKIQNNYAEVYGLLSDAHEEKGINWAIIESEVSYVPEDSGYDCSVFGTGGGTAQNDGCVTDKSYAWLEAPYVCKMQNGDTAYNLYRQYASNGGVAFAYSEAALGSFTGKIPFCPHNNW